MKISELLTEQTSTVGTIGSVGSSTTPPPPANPASSGSTTTPAKPGQQPDDNKINALAGVLKGAKVIQNPADVNNFLSGWQAQQFKKTLTPDQQGSMVALASALMTDKSLAGKLDPLLKMIGRQQPGQTATGTPE